MKKLLLFCLLLITGTARAQEMPQPVPEMPVPEEKREQDENKIFQRVEIEPSFKGDIAAFVQKNLKYPKKARKKRITGTVIVEFIVDLEGRVTDAKLLPGSPTIDPLLVAEALRVIRLTNGQWQPGVQNGRPVKCYRRQPVNFLLK